MQINAYHFSLELGWKNYSGVIFTRRRILMAKSDVFNKKHEDAVAQDKRAILEELNLPPEMITFIRKNSKTINILIAVVIIGLVAWEGYGKYISVQREKSSAMLSAAMSAEPNARVEQLKALTEKYSRSGSAAWAQVELGHLALKDEKFQEAVGFYGKALDGLSKKNPMYPLVLYCLAQAYEDSADSGKAKEAYQQLAEVHGFAAEGYLGLGRLAEIEGDLQQALAQYTQYVNQPEIASGPTKEWVESRISQLNGAQ
jgi:tetratricopeptide (TPR) repeat protein